ncbi:hypothetical protein Tco_0743138, partial [Tanacetum coccineum]
YLEYDLAPLKLVFEFSIYKVWKSVRYGISKYWIRHIGDFLELGPRLISTTKAKDDSLLLTPLCCDDIHDVTPRVSALAGCDRLVSEPLVIEKGANEERMEGSLGNGALVGRRKELEWGELGFVGRSMEDGASRGTNAEGSLQALNVDSLKDDLIVIQNTCSEKDDSNSETASSKSVKESILNSETKDVHAIKYKM